MISNIPTFTQHQDFQARHADMLAAARGQVTPKMAGKGSLLWTCWQTLPRDPRITVSRALARELGMLKWDDESLTPQQRVDAFFSKTSEYG